VTSVVWGKNGQCADTVCQREGAEGNREWDGAKQRGILRKEHRVFAAMDFPLVVMWVSEAKHLADRLETLYSVKQVVR
jgi:hypothetical protein